MPALGTAAEPLRHEWSVQPARSVAFSLWLTAIIALSLLLGLFPWSFLVGTHAFWANPTDDLTQHMMGAAYFARSPWGLPLFQVPDLGSPGGTNIVYTDSIPIAALAAKLLYGLTGRYYHPFGIWFSLCAVLQPVCFGLLLAALGVRHWAVLVPGALLALFTPFLLIRFTHLALCGQWLVVLALALHVATLRGGFGGRSVIGYLALALLALLVHPYLFAFTLCVLAMTISQLLWVGRLGAAGAIGRLAAVTAPLLPVMALTGHLGEGLRPKPLGEYALDLASPFVPQHSGLLPPLSDFEIVGFETMVWVGAGAMFLIMLALWTRRASLRASAAAHGGELAILTALVLVSATYAIQVGTVLVAGVSPALMRAAILGYFQDGSSPMRVFAVFGVLDWLRVLGLLLLWSGAFAAFAIAAWKAKRRAFLRFCLLGTAALLVFAAVAPLKLAVMVSNLQASARFIWIVLYFGLAASIAALARRWPKEKVSAVLVAALALQIIDTLPLAKAVVAHAQDAPRPMLPDQDAIADAFRSARRIELVPTYTCAFIELKDSPALADAVAAVRSLHAIAARSPVPINSSQNSRATAAYRHSETPDCAGERSAALGPIPHGTVRVFVRAGWVGPGALDDTIGARTGCAASASGVLCRNPD